MIEIGKYQLLTVNREVDFGVYMGDGTSELLLPGKYIPDGLKVGDKLRVFVYKDSEDRPIATTLKPAGQAGDMVPLTVKDLSPHGAFMEWGLEKDLFVPKREQHIPFEVGQTYLIKIVLDYKTNRLIGTGKIRPFLAKDPEDLEEGQKVKLLIYGITDLGYNAVIDGRYSGLIYKTETSLNPRIGDSIEGFVFRIRPDGKIDLRTSMSGKEGADQNRDKLLELLEANKGKLQLTDKSSPEDILAQTGMSKKAFKKAVGNLYSERRIRILDDAIELDSGQR